MNMGISDKLREFQDRQRDSGWRIKWLPWQEQGRPEYVHNTPLTLITGFGGAGVFVLALILLAKRPSLPLLGLAAAGLTAILLGRLYAAYAKQSGWVRVNAQCLDRETQAREYPHGGNTSTVWEYRLLCAFTLGSADYKVTPESSRLMAFNSEAEARAYLEGRIGPDGSCSLWVDPANPQHAVFDSKQGI